MWFQVVADIVYGAVALGVLNANGEFASPTKEQRAAFDDYIRQVLTDRGVAEVDVAFQFITLIVAIYAGWPARTPAANRGDKRTLNEAIEFAADPTGERGRTDRAVQAALTARDTVEGGQADAKGRAVAKIAAAQAKAKADADARAAADAKAAEARGDGSVVSILDKQAAADTKAAEAAAKAAAEAKAEAVRVEAARVARNR